MFAALPGKKHFNILGYVFAWYSSCAFKTSGITAFSRQWPPAKSLSKILTPNQQIVTLSASSDKKPVSIPALSSS
jgi:hypothetical protein